MLMHCLPWNKDQSYASNATGSMDGRDKIRCDGILLLRPQIPQSSRVLMKLLEPKEVVKLFSLNYCLLSSLEGPAMTDVVAQSNQSALLTLKPCLPGDVADCGPLHIIHVGGPSVQQNHLHAPLSAAAHCFCFPGSSIPTPLRVPSAIVGVSRGLYANTNI
jgi:hypothetical protein